MWLYAFARAQGCHVRRLSTFTIKRTGYAFTEAGRNVSFGGLLKGTSWRRPNDVLGAVFSLNMLGPDHRACLAAGDSGAFPGDGELNYGHERVLELFYSFPPAKGITLSPRFI